MSRSMLRGRARGEQRAGTMLGFHHRIMQVLHVPNCDHLLRCPEIRTVLFVFERWEWYDIGLANRALRRKCPIVEECPNMGRGANGGKCQSTVLIRAVRLAIRL